MVITVTCGLVLVMDYSVIAEHALNVHRQDSLYHSACVFQRPALMLLLPMQVIALSKYFFPTILWHFKLMKRPNNELKGQKCVQGGQSNAPCTCAAISPWIRALDGPVA